MKPTAYIETTIPSYLTAKPSRDIFQLARQSITHQWWDTKRKDYELVTSDFTIIECKKGDPIAIQRRLDSLSGIRLLHITNAIEPLSNKYMTLLLAPNDCKIDMLHLAICVLNEIDYLLTWNCKHLGPLTMERVQTYNEKHGLFVPLLTTPEAFFDEREILND